MKRSWAALLSLSLALGLFGGCSRTEQPPPLQQDAVMVAQGIQTVWGAKSPAQTLFYVNAEKKSEIPPALQGLIISPTTTFDYLYVRSWDERRQGQSVRHYVAHYVIRDLNSGVLLRGDMQDGITTFQPLPVNFWDLVS